MKHETVLENHRGFYVSVVVLLLYVHCRTQNKYKHTKGEKIRSSHSAITYANIAVNAGNPTRLSSLCVYRVISGPSNRRSPHYVTWFWPLSILVHFSSTSPIDWLASQQC